MGGWNNINNKTAKDSKDALKANAKAMVKTPHWGVSTKEPWNGIADKIN